MPCTCRTGVIVREAAKCWPGNEKVYFKQNEQNRLKLEELVTTLSTTCEIKEIGFGRGTDFIYNNYRWSASFKTSYLVGK